MWEGLDSRKFPRVKAECQIRLESIDGQETMASVTENIGRGGFCTVLDKPLGKLSHVQVRLDLKDGGKPIECAGKIVWIVEKRSLQSSQKSHDTGIEFLDLSDADLMRLKFVVERYSKQ